MRRLLGDFASLTCTSHLSSLQRWNMNNICLNRLITHIRGSSLSIIDMSVIESLSLCSKVGHMGSALPSPPHSSSHLWGVSLHLFPLGGCLLLFTSALSFRWTGHMVIEKPGMDLFSSLSCFSSLLSLCTTPLTLPHLENLLL